MSFPTAADTNYRGHPDVTPDVLSQFDMAGKVALITGGCGWLGTAFCLALAEVGATVVVSSRELSKAEAQAASLPTPKGQKHAGVALDQSDEDSLKKGFAAAAAAAGHVDVLINNGLQAPSGDIDTVTFDDFHKMQLNNAGYFCLGRELKDHCVARNVGGAVVNIGSMYGQVWVLLFPAPQSLPSYLHLPYSLPYFLTYGQVGSYPDAYSRPGGASPIGYHCLKGGTIHMTRHMAAYWAEHGIRVNCLSPGPFPSAACPPEVRGKLETKLPMGRMGKPAELKGALVLLASDAGSFMTGQNITVDGGWTAW